MGISIVKMPKGIYERESFDSRLARTTTRNVETGCLLYTGNIDRSGYGQISVSCKTVTIHRAVWKSIHGDIADGIVIGHLCDEKYPIDSIENRRCCEITHLYLTNTKENTQRMYALGRGVTPSSAFKPGQCSGENNLNAKITWVKVREIRAKIAKGLAYGDLTKLATEYGISYPLAQKIKDGTKWKVEDDPENQNTIISS